MVSGERVTRSKLPHWYKPGHAHFVTYRLSGSIPGALLRQWRLDRETAVRAGPPQEVSVSEHRVRVHKKLFARYDRYLDRSTHNAWLLNESVATMIRKNLYYHHGEKYELLSYCIMPNHVHLLLQPFELGPETKQAGSLHYGDQTDVVSDEFNDAQSP